MKKFIATLLLAVVATSAFAAEVPKEIKARYESLTKVLDKLDGKAFESFFSSDFVNVDPKGKESKRADFLKEIGGLFAAGKSATTKETFTSCKSDKGTFAVGCDLTMVMKTKDGGTMNVHEVCTDYWKKAKGSWVIFKTVDTVFDVKETKPAGKKK